MDITVRFCSKQTFFISGPLFLSKAENSYSPKELNNLYKVFMWIFNYYLPQCTVPVHPACTWTNLHTVEPGIHVL